MAPRLTPDAAEMLSSHFISIRKEMKDNERDMNVRSSIPITVRQLEAIIRISESLAKMELNPHATRRHVEEALRLFKFSTMDAVNSGGGPEGMNHSELMAEVQMIEKELEKRIPVGSQVPVSRIRADFNNKGYSDNAITRALDILGRRDVLIFRNQGKVCIRQTV
jgi:DNA replication licensing factor MCM5